MKAQASLPDQNANARVVIDSLFATRHLLRLQSLR